MAKKLIIPTLLLIAVSSAFAQLSTISVLGSYKHSKIPFGHGMRIRFEESANKCDPVKGFITLEDQIKQFKETALARGLNPNDLQPELRTENDNFRQEPNTKVKFFKILLPNEEAIGKYLKICDEQEISVEKVFLQLPQSNLSDEDEYASNALKEARKTAETLAAHLGKKIVDIVNIDDYYSPEYETDINYMRPDDYRNNYGYGFQAFEYLMAQIWEEATDVSIGDSNYVLYVTFQMK